MLTLFQVASNPAILKTREGLRWLLGYYAAEFECNPVSFEQVMNDVNWDMQMVLNEYHHQASFLPPPAYQYSVCELPF